MRDKNELDSDFNEKIIGNVGYSYNMIIVQYLSIVQYPVLKAAALL